MSISLVLFLYAWPRVAPRWIPLSTGCGDQRVGTAIMTDVPIACCESGFGLTAKLIFYMFFFFAFQALYDDVMPAWLKVVTGVPIGIFCLACFVCIGGPLVGWCAVACSPT